MRVWTRYFIIYVILPIADNFSIWIELKKYINRKEQISGEFYFRPDFLLMLTVPEIHPNQLTLTKDVLGGK